MTRKYFYSNRLRHAIPFAAASFTVGLALFACSDKDIDSNENNGKALVAFNVLEKQDQAQAAAKAGLPMTRTAFANQLALQNLAPEDLTMQKLPVQGAAASSDICLIETTVPGVPSQFEATAQTRADITTLSNMGNFSTTAFYGSSDTSLEPWFYDKDTKKDGNLVAPIYWDWLKNHGCFYAVYPKPYSKLQLSPSTYTGTPYVDFEVEPNVKNQKDLMTACSGNVHTDIGAMSATAPRTDLTFRHALTAVRFKVGQNLSWNKTITKVEIIGAKSKGRYTLPTDKTVTGAWNPASLSAPATFTLGGDGTVSVSTSAAVNNVIMGNSGDNFVFYMIPQSLAGVSVKIYFADATPPIAVNLTGTWKPGTTKTYALSQNTSSWQYELTVTPPAPAEYNATTTDNYKIESYREDPVSHTKQAVPWEVVGYDTDGDGTFSMTEPLPSWFTGLTTTNGNGSITTTGETGVANLVPDVVDKLARMNAALKLNAKGSASDYYDLSTHDIKGNTTLRNTANCYVISHPGYYKIPLVYGNAITDGKKKVNAYQTSNTGTFILTHFKDHNNQDITDPWIEKTNGGANNGVNDAKVVWADTPNLVHFDSNPIVRSGNETFVQFEVKASDIQNGNAVIAVTKGGTVVWSWHLWFIHDDALNTIVCTNAQNKKYKFIQEMLGMKYTAWNGTNYTLARSVKVKIRQTRGQISPATRAEGVVTITQKPEKGLRQGFSTYYQFGRKDAFPGTDDNLVGTFNKNAGNNMSIPNSIQHPENFYTHGSSWTSNPPAGYTWYNLWSANNTTTGYNDNPVVKTVYDPCPAGFKLPASNAFTGFETSGLAHGTFDNKSFGWDLDNKAINPDASIYFPNMGFRYGYDGLQYNFRWFGFCYAAVPASGGNGAAGMNLSPFQVQSTSGTGCSGGNSIRPVADTKTKVTPKTPGSTEEQWGSEQQVGGTEIDLDN